MLLTRKKCLLSKHSDTQLQCVRMKEKAGENGSVKSTEYSRARSLQARYLASEGGIFIPVIICLVTPST